MLNKLIDIFIGDIPQNQRAAFTRIFFRCIFLVHIVWACGWLASLGLTGFARAESIEQVKRELSTQIAELNAKIETIQSQVARGQKVQTRTAYETELRRLNQEIFAVEARLKELTAAGIRADRIYDERLNDLKIERSRVESRLNAFLRANPDIAEATY